MDANAVLSGAEGLTWIIMLLQGRWIVQAHHFVIPAKAGIYFFTTKAHEERRAGTIVNSKS